MRTKLFNAKIINDEVIDQHKIKRPPVKVVFDNFLFARVLYNSTFLFQRKESYPLERGRRVYVLY